MDKKDRRLEALRIEYKQAQGKKVSRRDENKFNEQYWADAELSVKQLFFNFLLLTVNNYIGFYKDQDLETDAESNAAFDLHKFKSSDELFDFEGYLKWQEERAAKTGSSN